jgi:Na+-transporting NADH:ubiquinone oxidoreductase subunit C
MKKDSILYTVLFSFIVAFLFVLILALANESTKGIVERNEELARQKAVLDAMGYSYSTDREAETIYQSIEVLDKNGVRLYKGSRGDTLLYAKEFMGSGLWGTITGILCVDEAVSQIIGIQIGSHTEPPGLGGRISEPWFKEQFNGLKLKNGRIQVTFGSEAGSGKANKEEGIVDGITGASRTSQSINVIMDTELSLLKNLLGGSK